MCPDSFNLIARAETGPSSCAAASTTSSATGWISSPPHRLFRLTTRPGGLVVARLLILHGYGDHSGRFRHVMEWFAAHGILCDAFDFRGHGKSSGKRGYVARWQEFLDDLRAMLSAVDLDASRDGISDRPLFVLGHSHGGLIAATAGVDGILAERQVAGVILSAPYLKPAESLSPIWKAIAVVTNVVAPSLRVGSGLSSDMLTNDPAMKEDSRDDPLLLRSATPRWYASTLKTQRQTRERADRFKLPLLCLIGDADKIADPAAAKAFVAATSSIDKTFELLPGQKHEILREVDRLATFQRILDWMSHHFPPALIGPT